MLKLYGNFVYMKKDVGREIYKFEGNSDLLSDILLREDPEFMWLSY